MLVREIKIPIFLETKVRSKMAHVADSELVGPGIRIDNVAEYRGSQISLQRVRSQLQWTQYVFHGDTIPHESGLEIDRKKRKLRSYLLHIIVNIGQTYCGVSLIGFISIADESRPHKQFAVINTKLIVAAPKTKGMKTFVLLWVVSYKEYVEPN